MPPSVTEMGDPIHHEAPDRVEDADAAQRVCDALRTAGLEVWFDQSELRGGDAWDAAIRKQVKECALFMPLISANSEARSEGGSRASTWRRKRQNT